MLAEYAGLQRQIAEQGVTEIRIANRFGWRKNLSVAIAKRLCQGIWIWQLRAGTLDVAMAMYLNMLTEDLLASMSAYAAMLERIYEGIEPAKVLVELLEEPPAIADPAGVATVAAPAQACIRMTNVRFSYRGGKQAVENLNLTVPAGKVLGIVGRSGAGKTTLQNLLTRTFEVDKGRITVGGTDIRLWPLKQLRAMFAQVNQGGGVFFSGATLLETIRFARAHAAEGDVMDAARCACIHDDILRMPVTHFTYSKVIDNVSGDGGIAARSAYNLRLEKAVGDFDTRRRYVISGGYQLPFGPGKRFGGGTRGWKARLIEGYEIFTMGIYQSGPWITPGMGFQGVRTAHGGSARPDLVPGVPVRYPTGTPARTGSISRISRATITRPLSQNPQTLPWGRPDGIFCPRRRCRTRTLQFRRMCG
jgi:ABC-type iron transport system FetAB ATPase subunit